MRKWFFLLIVLAVFFEVIADMLFKYWSINAKGAFLFAGLALYTIGTFIRAYSLKFEFLSKAITIFTLLNLIAIVFAGIFLFKEQLTLLNKVGILLGIASVILIQW